MKMSYDITLGTILNAFAIIGIMTGIWNHLEKRLVTVEIRQDYMIQKLDATTKRMEIISDQQLIAVKSIENLSKKPNPFE